MMKSVVGSSSTVEVVREVETVTWVVVTCVVIFIKYIYFLVCKDRENLELQKSMKRKKVVNRLGINDLSNLI